MTSSKSARRFSSDSFCATTLPYSLLRFSACRCSASAEAAACCASPRSDPIVERSRAFSSLSSPTLSPSPSPAAAAAAFGDVSASAAAALARASISSASSRPESTPFAVAGGDEPLERRRARLERVHLLDEQVDAPQHQQQ
ncbi:hypothetical protein EMIHUDRAFT_351988 [Emiliania huxleyi CCMP1516]|uniref:Uncharacterized protein n=2 Tax=Emiliania huxleyi TaxID=2903 RepID=A0A0D3KHV5_EMIH1|nr:hypothetical protein EMIHUDRAFT_351988 [Emiliania huxleyi CCMP1516]EOD35340.1 hypothetical protein EMIHUDRAFT_351988 [Emiliania huxleyi CCMP1516]|eukprot:XP_005787769.1 hypothetical protein EMIHUDRAFT_351988 [Emiliania huxleyi CCMP1516]